MATGKYSPTVNCSYGRDQDWHDKHKLNPTDSYDRDGYDMYGYDKNDTDRAGIKEHDYMVGEWIGDDYRYPLYEDIWELWSNKFIPDLRKECYDNDDV